MSHESSATAWSPACGVTATGVGLILPSISGAVEGRVHRSKMVKRQMYGRAGFELHR
ncbi:hypothetical protein [Streptomyces camelliae]|uniref:Transposase n=1 Tax=Streptomyces camelliae TaxID=3004093 RepID=A0ABY7NWQ7_9ACTN|nr:hypothetical protein [Streptomyces sp. HUAS 2-6]WBO61684.1 hypothetical protein O1G22_01845 [Streptomyces sp. HUAS 2-6]